jgi:hypothetical protein
VDAGQHRNMSGTVGHEDLRLGSQSAAGQVHGFGQEADDRVDLALTPPRRSLMRWFQVASEWNMAAKLARSALATAWNPARTRLVLVGGGCRVDRGGVSDHGASWDADWWLERPPEPPRVNAPPRTAESAGPVRTIRRAATS